MSSLNTIKGALVGLAALVAAVPTPQSNQWTECQAGTWFYRCANGYVGCFNYDPCSLPSKAANEQTSTTTTTIITPTTITPTTTTTTTTTAVGTPPTACPTSSPGARIYRPTMWTISPSQPNLSRGAISHIEVSFNVSGTPPATEQVMAFHGIPANARTCRIGWSQASVAERVFREYNGLVNTTQLTGFPADTQRISYNAITPFEDPANMRSGLTQFTSWDEPNFGAQDHSQISADCAESMFFKIRLSSAEMDGFVYMEQDHQNGYYIQYTC